MKITLSNDVLDAFVLQNEDYLVDKEYYNPRSGINEYRLYSYMTTLFNNITILDIGTFRGRSAVAWSHNPTNTVLSYDVHNHIRNPSHRLYTKPNIRFFVKNVLEDITPEFVQNIRIVCIDIDHYGNTELQIIHKLKEVHFKGLIFLDDTTGHPDAHIKRCMQEMWDCIPYEKYDITKYGHSTGTGLVVMDDELYFKFT